MISNHLFIQNNNNATLG